MSTFSLIHFWKFWYSFLNFMFSSHLFKDQLKTHQCKYVCKFLPQIYEFALRSTLNDAWETVALEQIKETMLELIQRRKQINANEWYTINHKHTSDLTPICEFTTARDRLALAGWQLVRPPTNWHKANALNSCNNSSFSSDKESL